MATWLSITVPVRPRPAEYGLSVLAIPRRSWTAVGIEGVVMPKSCEAVDCHP